MKKVTAKLGHLHMPARKVRLAGQVIVGMDAERALIELQTSEKGVSGKLQDLLKSAIANAKNNHSLDEKTLKVAELRVEEGPTMKRWRPVSRGQAHSIMKRTCHIILTVEGKEIKGAAKKKADKKDIKVEKVKTREDISKVAGAEEKDSKKDTRQFDRSEPEKKAGGKGFFKKLFRRKAGE